MNSLSPSGIVKVLFACGVLASAALAFTIPGCSPDQPATDNSDASSGADAPDPCDVDAFFAGGGNGGSCFPVTVMACFAQCTNGGCTCTRNPAGGDMGIWKCITDISCLPDGGPFDDDSGPGVDADLGDVDVGDTNVVETGVVDAGFDADGG